MTLWPGIRYYDNVQRGVCSERNYDRLHVARHNVFAECTYTRGRYICDTAQFVLIAN